VNRAERGNQAILTANVEVGGQIQKVAMPNTPENEVSEPWRPEQRQAAIELGYTPLAPPADTTPGLHAEENLEVWRVRNGAQIRQWSVAHGGRGSSSICKKATCREITKGWPAQTQ
jgi:hypothetical protein